MRLIIEARVELADSDLQPELRRLAVLDRMDDDLGQLGLTLEEGRELLAAAQSALGKRSNGWPRKITAVDAAPRCTTRIVGGSFFARYLGKAGYRVGDSGPVLVIDRVARADTPSAH